MVVIHDNVKFIWVVVQQICNYVIGIPTLIYFVYRFSKSRSSIMIQKRYPKILTINGIFILSFLTFNYPIMSTDWCYFDQFDAKTQLIVSRFDSTLYSFLVIGIFITAAWRFWHIYFDLKYSASQENSEWKFHLDPSLVKHNFWLTHKKDYGSQQYTQKIVVSYYLFNVAVIVTANQFLLTTPHIMIAHIHTTFWNAIAAAIPFIFYYVTPEYRDHFFLREEMKIVSYASAAVNSFAIISFLIGIYSMDVILMVLPACGAILFYTMAVVSFIFIPRKIRFEEDRIKLVRLMKRKSSNNDTSTPTSYTYTNKLQLAPIVRRLSANQLQPSLHKSYKLPKILSNERSFKIFMQHLAKEISTECLLCFVETIQYKFAFKQRFDIIDEKAITDEMEVGLQCPMSEVVPTSVINREGFGDLAKYKFNDNHSTLMTQAKHVCLKLYKKYIETGSELEVNIAYDGRLRLTGLMDDAAFFMDFNINPNELFSLYDDVTTSMFHLMHGAFLRFKQTAEFNVACKEIQHFQTISLNIPDKN